MTGTRAPFVPVALVVVLVVAGCTAPLAPTVSDRPDRSIADEGIGTVNGISYDAELSIDASDGLNETEREQLVARSMARVEVIRGLAFERTVEVDVISREEYRERRGTRSTNEDREQWENEVWKALLIVDEDTGVDEAFDSVYGAAVAGYYTSADGGRIVLVSDDEQPTVDRHTLVHELVHALQDQRFGLGPRGDSIDGQNARNGLIEGDAEYVPQLYEQRCEEEWDCLERPPSGPSAELPTDFNRALYLTILHPYSDGPPFVADLHERADGWEAVNAAYDDRPQSAAQITHPDRYPDDPPRNVTVADRSTDRWERFTDLPRGQSPHERVGEAALVGTFYAQGELDGDDLRTDEPLSIYDYDQEPTNGWAGDAVVPYRSDDETGYVFATEWTSEADATEFRDAYERTLSRMGAEELDSGVYRIADEDSFSGAYRVRQSGDRVEIVHAPTVDALDELHPIDADAASAVAAPSRGSDRAAGAEPAAAIG